MTARCKNRRERNLRVRKDRNKLRDLKRSLGLSGKDLINKVQEITTEKTAEQLVQEKRAIEEQVREEFIKEKKEEFEKSEKIAVKNEKTNIVHVFDSKTLKDQFGSYPIWLNKNIRKRQVIRRKKDKQFWVGSYMPE